LRVRWGKPKPLDNLDREERIKNAREGRSAVGTPAKGSDKKTITAAGDATTQEKAQSYTVAPPPGSGDVQYASMNGD
jgi:hypothetical protein